jgi:hypothetical protein
MYRRRPCRGRGQSGARRGYGGQLRVISDEYYVRIGHMLFPRGEATVAGGEGSPIGLLD